MRTGEAECDKFVTEWFHNAITVFGVDSREFSGEDWWYEEALEKPFGGIGSRFWVGW